MKPKKFSELPTEQHIESESKLLMPDSDLEKSLILVKKVELNEKLKKLQEEYLHTDDLYKMFTLHGQIENIRGQLEMMVWLIGE